jgi:hypothetical protein
LRPVMSARPACGDLSNTLQPRGELVVLHIDIVDGCTGT